MHQSSSKPHIQKSSTKLKKMHEQRARNPFQDLKNANPIASATNSSSNSSSLSSIDAPKGCLRFFLSHTCNTNHGISRKKLVSTPKSAPNLRPAKENSSKRFNFHKPQKPDRSKKNPPALRNVNGSSGKKLKSDFREVEQGLASGVRDFDGLNSTPVNKVSRSNPVVDNGVLSEKSKTGHSSNTKTPPVQASVSPEIQCGSSMATTAPKTITPVCYGAGFAMSGVTDKRKCRPRGILSIGEAKPLSSFEFQDEIEGQLGFDNESAISALPLPSEASMHWLLSPCNEEDEEKKEDPENPNLSPSPLGSGNVIQTPESDHSDRVRKSNYFDYNLNSIAEQIQNASLSPKGYVSIWDPAGSSFRFDYLSPPSKSVDLSHFRKVLDDRASWLSDRTAENVSESRMRISWREGLVSRVFEMDEFDSCRCLSDLEDEIIGLEPVLSNDSGCTIDVKSGHGNDEKAEEEIPNRVNCSCAESISTDGGSLVRSEDSDWTMCYKNKLFQ